MGKKKKIDSDFNIGFVHFSSEERNKVKAALRSLEEPGSTDELGIGRIRDAFADLMFPGITTLQHHAKYFVVLPQLYYSVAQQKGYRDFTEVKKEVFRLERELTEALLKGNPNTIGITGSTRYKDEDFVTQDPTYIYWTGMVRFGIAKKSDSPYRQIFNYSSSLNEDDGAAGDDTSPNINSFFCDLPDKSTIFEKKGKINDIISLKLNRIEAEFLKKHICSSEGTKDSLLAFLLANDNIKKKDFLKFKLSSKNKKINEQLILAQKFTRFIYPIHLRYNYLFAQKSNGDPDYWEEKFDNALKYSNDVYNQKTLDSIFNCINGKLNDNGAKNFCQRILKCIKSKKMKQSDKLKQLDKEIINRELSVSKGRKNNPSPPKLSHPETYTFYPVHNHMLTYRWDTAWEIIQAIRMGLGVNNG